MICFSIVELAVDISKIYKIEYIPNIGNMELIKIKGVSKSFGSNVVLNDINLSIPSGGIFGIIGINGSGKTTLLKVLIGFYNSNKGEVFFKGKDIKKQDISMSFGFATQDNCFYDKLTVEENIKYFGRLYGLKEDFINEHMKNLLLLVKLYDAKDKVADELSSGMKRRLDLACALIHDPEVLILDEPTEDLDPSLRSDMLHLIRKIAKSGRTIIMTSHLLGEVESVCDRIAILHDSTIIKSGTPSTIKDSYSKDDEIHLETLNKEYDGLIKRIGKRGVSKIIHHGNRLVIYSSQAGELLKRILSLVKGKDKIIMLNVSRPSLNEVFESLTKKREK